MEENAVTARSAEDISIDIQKNADLFADACIIIDGTNAVVQRSLNTALVVRNSLLGQRIAEEELRTEIETQKALFYLRQQEIEEGKTA